MASAHSLLARAVAVKPIAEREQEFKAAIKAALAEARKQNGVALMPYRAPMRAPMRAGGGRAEPRFEMDLC